VSGGGKVRGSAGNARKGELFLYQVTKLTESVPILEDRFSERKTLQESSPSPSFVRSARQPESRLCSREPWSVEKKTGSVR